MNVNKIDWRLLKEISVLNSNKKTLCFVFTKDFFKTKEMLLKRKIEIKDEYLFIKSFLCKASQKEIFSLSGIDAIDYIYSLSVASSMMYVSKKILATDEVKCYGKGVGIAFIDTGISPHFDFMIGRNRVEEFKDFVNQRKNMYDDNGHGTFVCGVCCGNGVMSKQKFSGVAPCASIFALKSLDANGEAGANKILDAMEWLFDNHKKNNIKVVCMSFGSEPLGVNDPIMMGADALWKDGVVVVAAAGNSGPEYQTIKSPGISKNIITVGGIDDNRIDDFSFKKEYFEIADFSSRGPALRKVKPDLVAPSVDIVSCGIEKPYTTLSGTSVAAPMIAGVASLILEKYKDFSPTQVKSLLLKICQPLGFDKNEEGYGLPNLKNLV